ncbi:MAG TPA: LysR family transcriptional regulator, partial [Pseudorhizobium sp.]|nr:LysR family transcriptional regulator [Pseudorhizobium sp.]
MSSPEHADLSLKHLRAFLCVIDAGSLSQASEVARRSPSTLSRSIAILQELLATALIDRSPFGLAVTAAGDSVVRRARIVERELGLCRDLLIRSHRANIRSGAALFRMQVDVAHLRALTAVVDYRSVQRAAHRLGLSQPAVSYCQTAFKIDPRSASKIDPLRRWLLARSERIEAGGEEEIGPGAFCAGRA